MRTIPEVIEDIKNILNEIERTEECTGETLVDIDELTNEILTINSYKGKAQTNADRIRSMSDEQLAEFLKKVKADYQWSDPDYPNEDDFGTWLEWIQSKAE